jgi:hypothetical protein
LEAPAVVALPLAFLLEGGVGVAEVRSTIGMAPLTFFAGGVSSPRIVIVVAELALEFLQMPREYDLK